LTVDGDLTILANQVEARRQSVLCNFETGKMMEKANGDDSSSIFFEAWKEKTPPNNNQEASEIQLKYALSRSAGLIGLVWSC
jgi:hypothetical protein